jgi:hypothetical protein
MDRLAFAAAQKTNGTVKAATAKKKTKRISEKKKSSAKTKAPARG